jgi:hypothetical protein
VLAKTIIENSKHNLTPQPYMSHFADKVTPEYLLHVKSAMKHSLDNWAGGRFLCMTIEGDTYKGMQNSVLDICI